MLLLSGEHDVYSPGPELSALASAFPNAEVSIVAGTDHYLWRREREAAAIVGSFAERALAG